MQQGFRELTEEELTFKELYKKYRQALDATLLISVNQHGIETSGRGIRATKIFTRQTLSAISLCQILPNLSGSRDPDAEHWDVCSLASLSRNIIDGYLALYYSGTESITEEEAELRFFLGQLHRNKEWHHIHKYRGSDREVLKEFEEGIEKQKNDIREHPFLPKLSRVQRDKAIKGHEMYYTRADFEERTEVCKQLRMEYQLLSNFVHPLPLSVERIDNDRGRGESNRYDISYSIMCVSVATRYLSASTVAIADFFHNELGKRFRSNIDPIREYQFV